MAEDFLWIACQRQECGIDFEERMALCRVFAAVPKGLRGIREKGRLVPERDVHAHGGLRTLYLLLLLPASQFAKMPRQPTMR